MFPSLTSFLCFFIPAVILILLGIAFEETVVRFERKLFAALKAVRKTVLESIAENRKAKAIRIAYRSYLTAKKANAIRF